MQCGRRISRWACGDGPRRGPTGHSLAGAGRGHPASPVSWPGGARTPRWVPGPRRASADLETAFRFAQEQKGEGPQPCGPASGGQGPHAVRDSPESLGSQMRSDELQPLIHCWVFLLFNHNAVVPALVIFVCVKTESLKEAQKGASIENT